VLENVEGYAARNGKRDRRLGTPQSHVAGSVLQAQRMPDGAPLLCRECLESAEFAMQWIRAVYTNNAVDVVSVRALGNRISGRDEQPANQWSATKRRPLALSTPWVSNTKLVLRSVDVVMGPSSINFDPQNHTWSNKSSVFERPRTHLLWCCLPT
jgi:hypothetical protein